MTQPQTSSPPQTRKPINPAEDYDLTMDGPAIYKIQVQGVLEDSWSEKIGGLLIEAIPESGMTVIRGAIIDQAALSGVLNTLYELQLPVISVEYISR